MLARKHYSQKGNSKGNMNTRPISGSSSIVLNNRKRSQTNNTTKKIDDYTSQLYTDWKKHMIIKCTETDNTTTKTSTSSCVTKCNNKGGVITSRKINYVHKDILINNQGSNLQKIKERRVCYDNEPKPFNNITGGCL
jgi:hypothetical protein